MINYDYIYASQRIIKALKIYHKYSVSGLDHIPHNKPAIIVVNHSLASYDIFMLADSIFNRTGRLVRPLVDRLFEKIPPAYSLATKMGGIAGYHHNGVRLLNEDQLVLVAPGGMAEALKPSSDKYTTRWQNRKGFIKLSIETGCPIIIAMCPHSDDLYKVYDTSLTKWAYKKLRIPMIIARGLGPTIIPRPVKLKHYIAPPIFPPKKNQDPKKTSKQIDDFHKKVSIKATELIDFAIKKQKKL